MRSGGLAAGNMRFVAVGFAEGNIRFVAAVAMKIGSGGGGGRRSWECLQFIPKSHHRFLAKNWQTFPPGRIFC